MPINRPSNMQLSEAFACHAHKLKAYQDMWQYPLVQNPERLENIYPAHWLTTMAEVPLPEISEAFWRGPDTTWPQDFAKFYHWAMSPVPDQIISHNNLGIDSNRGFSQNLSPKKRYEIETLSQWCRHHFPSTGTEIKRSTSNNTTNVQELRRGLDIAGGRGHLASRLNACGYKMTSIDWDQRLQTEGDKNYGLFAPQYLNYNILESDLKKIYQAHHFTVGLHTCGSLALQHLQQSWQGQINHILNLGCCYDKFSRKNNEWGNKYDYLDICENGRHLASRFHPIPSATPNATIYRYALMLWLKKKGMKGPTAMGRPKKQWLKNCFGTYAIAYLNKIGIEHHWSKHEINDFIQKKTIEDEIRRYAVANLIRTLIGRPIEIYLIMQRALILEEKGYSVKLIYMFDPQVSPRNIAIYAQKNCPDEP